MICVSIGNVSSGEARALMLECGADLVELRLDLIARPDLEKLLAGNRRR